jgi:catechol 2,3-dioxygenase-like lactoylglutathione lyase family enzyme
MCRSCTCLTPDHRRSSVSDMLGGFHHITHRVSDLERSRRFYSALPEFTLDQDFPDLRKLRYRIGHARSRLVLCAPLPSTPVGDRFDEHRIGVDHIAIGVLGGRESLEQLEAALRWIGADTDGVKLDRAGELAMITFRDPDNVQWEFFEDEDEGSGR